MNRDKEEFADFLMLADLTNKVFYQVGLDFEHKRTDLAVIDESDALIFTAPLAMEAMLKNCRCICLTATPDDNNRKGAEKQVINDLNLSKFDYGYPEELTAPAKIDEIKALKNNEDKLAYIRE